MSRGIAASTTLAEFLEPAEPVFVLLTQLGDLWVLGLLVAVLYLVGPAAPLAGWDRRRGATVLAAGLLAVAVTGLLKAILGLPRPPGADTTAYQFAGTLGDIYTWAGTADGFGFPSGHAVGATAVFGTAAALVGPSQRRRALAVAGGLVAIVSLTRVALGVHYLVDVLAGVIVGLLLVALAVRWARRPTVPIGVAVLAGAGWALLADAAATPVGALGLCVGTGLAWSVLNSRLRTVPRVTGTGLAVLVAAGLVTASATVLLAETGGPVVAGLGGAIGMAVLIALPVGLSAANA
jgi:membrane-associated phospholipid phosphatase